MSSKVKNAWTISFFLIAWALFVTTNAQSDYHLSIFYHFSEFSLAVGLLILFLGYYAVIQDWWIGPYGAYLILLISFVILALPLTLGYEFMFGDPTTHISHAQKIVESGGLKSDLGAAAYPMLHLTWSSTKLITGQSIDIVVLQLALVSFIYFAAISGLITRNFCRLAVLGFVLAPLSLFKLAAPAAYSYALILPTVIFCITKPGVNTSKRTALFVVLFIALWVGHPIPPMIFSGILIFYILSRWLVKRFSWGQAPMLQRFKAASQEDTSRYWVILTIELVIGMTWFAFFTRWLQRSVFYSLKSVSPLMGTGSEETFGTASQDVGTIFSILDLNYFDFGWLAIKLYGQVGILLLISFLWVIGLSRSREQTRSNRFPLVLLFFVFIPPILSVIQFFSGLFSVISYGRLLRAAIYVAPALAGIALTDWLIRVRRSYTPRFSTMFSIFASILLVSGSIFAIVGLYPGPEQYRRNPYISESESTGWEWYFNNKATKIITVSPGTFPDRYAQRFLSDERLREEGDAVQFKKGVVCRTPRQFAGPTPLGNLFGGSYYVEPIRDRAWNIEMYHIFGRFNESDFHSLQRDSTVNPIYRSGGFTVSVVGKNPFMMAYPDACVQKWNE